MRIYHSSSVPRYTGVIALVMLYSPHGVTSTRRWGKPQSRLDWILFSPQLSFNINPSLFMTEMAEAG